jgi:hypothetical protein
MSFSLNNRLVLEVYVKEGLKAKVSGGIATPGQRDGVKGLRVLMDAYLADGRHIPKGSTAYIREEVLHTHPWASKPLSSEFLPVKFLLVESSYIEFFDICVGSDGKDIA